jgi:hypothetical protein
MRPTALSLTLVAGLTLLRVQGADLQFTSPGFTPTRMDDQGRLLEDWGAFGIRITGSGVKEGTASLTSVQLDGSVPAVRADWNLGIATATVTAFRAPVWPAGLDVYTIKIHEQAGHDANLTLALEVPPTVRPGAKTLSAGGRAVVALPGAPKMDPVLRDWGWQDDAGPIPGWAKPAKECDPAFRNIRAGMGGVPINYRFKVDPRSSCNVVLGLCESHWNQTGQRPVVCQVEGAASQEVDPLARWGQHQPGGVLFAAKDANGDGFVDVAVLPKIGAPDQNPILNVIWLFPPGSGPNLDQVIAGKLNSVATRYVDVGGPGDQSLEATSKIEYAVNLPAGGERELTFYVACGGGAVPLPDRTTWTLEKLRRSAIEVWRDAQLAPQGAGPGKGL